MNKTKNITRQSIYDLVHSELGLSKNYCSNFVDDIFNIIITGIKKEKKVKISLFGTFSNKEKKSRIGRNPKTKEEKVISSRNVVTFKPSKFLLKKINKFKSIRNNIFNFYTTSLSPIAEIDLPSRTPGSDPFWHLFPIRVPKDTRKKLFDYLRAKGIIVQVNYIPVYLHPVFEDLGYKKGLCPNAENFYEREISLPLHTKLNKSNLEYITECLHKFFK